MKFAESWTSSRPCRLGTAPPAAVTVIGEPAVPPFLIETSPVYVPSNRHPVSPAWRLWASLPTVLYGSLGPPPASSLPAGEASLLHTVESASAAEACVRRLNSAAATSGSDRSAASDRGARADSARGIILSPAAGPSWNMPAEMAAPG